MGVENVMVRSRASGAEPTILAEGCATGRHGEQTPARPEFVAKYG